MDTSLAIKASNLSKKYRLGTIGMTSLREDLSRWWNRGKADPLDKEKNPQIDRSRMINQNEFWALNELDFHIEKGEVVGLIGANGSGKSTLLKILSRITEPTVGEIHIRGKVASLLEVGTGFHPELTGRENVYINGAILGMTRKEVDKKFDEIVDFAGVTDFIDTPIKRYSSGMTVRLGFAVAAHLDPDILIVDEVLAVGDAAFQKKCIGKMHSISNSGRTIIFVSHNMASVEALCTRGFMLNEGKLVKVGEINETISHYIAHTDKNSAGQSLENKTREGTGEITLSSVRMLNSGDEEIHSIPCGKTVSFEFGFKKNKRINGIPTFGVSVLNSKGLNVTWLNHKLTNCEIDLNTTNRITFEIKKINFVPGTYYLTTFIGNHGSPVDWIPKAFTFEVIEGSFYKNGNLPKLEQSIFLTEFEVRFD